MSRVPIKLAAVFLLTILCCKLTFASTYSDDLTKCLVASTSDKDKTLLVKWVFAMMALHPAVRSISSISDSQRKDLTKSVGKLLERVLTESCSSEFDYAMQYEPQQALPQSFGGLGRAAFQELMNDSSVAKGFEGLATVVDVEKLKFRKK